MRYCSLKNSAFWLVWDFSTTNEEPHFFQIYGFAESEKTINTFLFKLKSILWTFQALLTRWDFLRKLGFVTFLALWLSNLMQKLWLWVANGRTKPNQYDTSAISGVHKKTFIKQNSYTDKHTKKILISSSWPMFEQC